MFNIATRCSKTFRQCVRRYIIAGWLVLSKVLPLNFSCFFFLFTSGTHKLMFFIFRNHLQCGVFETSGCGSLDLRQWEIFVALVIISWIYKMWSTYVTLNIFLVLKQWGKYLNLNKIVEYSVYAFYIQIHMSLCRS